ncbi:uncharacterized protein [Haliotis cracherodii]|uniref:uncharacterized protein isoform X2 n=1 Tax=Haliotis cracherodii TaxID=6455 RepID=UPI0039E9CA57
MSGWGQYLARFAYDLIFFSNDVQTTTIAMAITGSLCCSILWAIIHVVTLIHDPPGHGDPKSATTPTELAPLHGLTQMTQRSLMSTSLDVLCIRCGRLMSNQKCRYGMCSGCCLGRRQCRVHQSLVVSDSVVMGLRITGPKGIDLSNSCMSSVPERLGFVGAQLTYLNLSCNSLTQLPPDIGCLQGLRELQLNGNQLTHIPSTLGSLHQLTELNLRHNQLADIPDALLHLPSLKHLNVEHNQLTSLSPGISHLLLLEELYAGYNCLTSLPSAIGKLFNLKVLSVHHNKMATGLPSSIGKLICLQQLDVEDCDLSCLPPTLGRCMSLRTLKLCHNRLSYLPYQLSQLQQLQELYVTDNGLSSFPAAMENMAIKMVEVSGNPLITRDTAVILSNETTPSEVLTFPPLIEIVARQIVLKKIGYRHLLPDFLQDLLQARKQCCRCKQPVFRYHHTAIRQGVIGKYRTKVPLKETLCAPHLSKKCPLL